MACPDTIRLITVLVEKVESGQMPLSIAKEVLLSQSNDVDLWPSFVSALNLEEAPKKVTPHTVKIINFPTHDSF
jgi:hypothetical protein